MLARTLSRLVDAQAGWAAPLGKLLQRLTNAVLGPVRPLRDFLNGTWLGHSLHAALTDVPIGAMTLVIVLDLVGHSPAADVALGFTVLAMLAAAVSGATDHADTVGRERNVATVHATLMTTALVLFIVALVLRLGGGPERGAAIAIGLVGYLVMLAGAWIGGEAVFGLGIAVDRHAWLAPDRKRWRRLEIGELTDGQPTRATAGDTPLVVVRAGSDIRALHETCAHAGGPLSEGSVVDGAIECPWHGSRFDLATGDVRRGPSTHAQPVFEVRPSEDGGYEVRLAS
jgi:nitrite reductase/ring-hydroxylating ferredoxin subunit